MNLLLFLACTSVFGKWFPITIASNKPFIDVRIAGSAPQRFLFDTGSNASLIDPSLAKGLGFKIIQSSEANQGVGNARTTFLRYDSPACEEVAGAVPRFRTFISSASISRRSRRSKVCRCGARWAVSSSTTSSS